MTEPPSKKAYRQTTVVVLALVIWAAWGRHDVTALLISYIAALAVVNLAVVTKTSLLPKLTRAQALVLLGVPAVVPLALIERGAGVEVLEKEGLRHVRTLVADRLRLEGRPAIHPAVVVSDQPQRLYVSAPGAGSVQLRLPGAQHPIEATALGHGVFRVEYDPKRDGPPAERSGPVTAALVVDGRDVDRELDAVVHLAHPRWLASSPDTGRAAAVSEETDELILVDREAKVRRVAVGDGPTDCRFFDEGRKVAVAHAFDPELYVVDVASGDIVHKIPVGRFQRRMAVSPDGRELALAVGGDNRGVQLVDLSNVRRSGSIRLGFAADWIEYGATGDDLVVAWRERKTLYRLSRGDDDGARGLPLPGRQGDGPSGFRMTPKALPLGRPVVAMGRSLRGGIVVTTTGLAEDGSEVLGNHFVQHLLLFIDVDAWKITRTEVTDRHSNAQDVASTIEHGAGPIGFSAIDGGFLVAFSGSAEVWRMVDGAPTERFALDDQLPAPHGVADLGEGAWAVSSPSTGTIGIYDRAGKRKGLARLAPADAELKKSDPAAWLRRQGEKAYYEATRTGISCHSCHLYADSDYSRHNIGQSTLLPTLSTFGIGRSSPYLRDASYPRIRDMMQVVNSIYRGFRKQAKAPRGASLEAYVETLAPLPNPYLFEVRDIERERVGLDAFVKADCHLCHEFPAFTNLGQIPSRVAFPKYSEKLHAKHLFDVPSLIGLATSAPYLHDGRAKDLEAVLVEHNKTNRHGNVAALSDEERASLVYLLERL